MYNIILNCWQNKYLLWETPTKTINCDNTVISISHYHHVYAYKHSDFSEPLVYGLHTKILFSATDNPEISGFSTTHADEINIMHFCLLRNKQPENISGKNNIELNFCWLVTKST